MNRFLKAVFFYICKLIIKKLQIMNVENYIESFPEETQAILNHIRLLVKKHVPNATEIYSYKMAGYKTYGKPLLYFAGYNKHIGFYSTPSGHEKFKQILSKYKQGKGSVQFPLDQEIPYNIIEEMIIFRRDENEKKFGSN